MTGDMYYDDTPIYDGVPEDEDMENMIIDLSEFHDESYLRTLSYNQLDRLWMEYFD